MRRWTVDLETYDWRQDPVGSSVCQAIENGELVAVPTETVYGLAADATSGRACARIFEAKGRPSFNPLISHVPSLDIAQQHGVFDEQALQLADAFWPGPLTLVVPKKPDSPICDLATSGLPTVALRVPAGPVMRYLAERTGRPLAAPSANRSGKISPTCAEDVVQDLGQALSFVIDAGPCEVGIESTIVGVTGGAPVLLRPGGISREQIEEALGRPLENPDVSGQPDAPSAPGMLTSHYAPNADMSLEATGVAPDEALLSFGPTPLPGANGALAEFNLSATADLTEAAANLFKAMRSLDSTGAQTIRVQHIPSFGLGEAINDRLRRAAAPRS